MLAWRSLWKDWGFPEALFRHARHFLELARQEADDERLGHIRASMVFYLMSVEAHFNEVVGGFITSNKEKIDAAKLQKIDDDRRRRVSIDRRLRKWPQRLTGSPLKRNTEPYQTYEAFRQYRNALLHGNITAPISELRQLAQEMETLQEAVRANANASEMIKVISKHFGFETPEWIEK